MLNRLIRIVIIILLSAVMLTTVCCDRHSSARDKMDLAESFMNSKPDSMLSILDRVNPETLRGNEETARYALLKSIALDKNYVDTTTFDVLQPAIDYYLKKGSPDEKLRTYYYQGRIYQNRGDDNSAMQSFMRGREYCGQASDTLTMANLLVAQGTILYTTYKFDDFIRVNLEAAKLYGELGRADYEILSLANVLDGSILNGDKKLADSIMSVAHDKISKNHELSYAVTPHMLSYAVKFGDKEDISSILSYYNSIDSIDDVTKMDVAMAYCKIEDTFNAKRFWNAIPSTSEVRTSLKYLALKPNILEQSGDYAGALAAYRSFSAVLDSIHLNIFSHDLLFAKERHEMEKSNLLKLQKRDRFIWLSLCVVFVLLIIIGYIYYHYRLGKEKNLLEEQENKRLQLEQENLRFKNKQLEDESISFKGILEKRKDLDKPIEDAIKVRIEMLNGLLATHITENDSYAKPYGAWRDQLIQDKEEFMNTTRLAFKASHPRFMEYLEEHGLTESEINYVCLYAIGLRGKEAGEYIQLKRHYHISSEVRRKLGIDEHQTNIGIYIRKLMKKL